MAPTGFRFAADPATDLAAPPVGANKATGAPSTTAARLDNGKGRAATSESPNGVSGKVVVVHGSTTAGSAAGSSQGPSSRTEEGVFSVRP